MKTLRRIAIGLLVVLIPLLSPIVWVEIACTVPRAATAQTVSFGIDDPLYRRAGGDSYLSYPEWNIVHAYADLAGVTRLSSESGFDYLASIGGFWSSLCHSTETAMRIGPVSSTQKTVNYIVGISFTLEMALQGLYERTFGALTAWIRGPDRTPEDDFALRLLDEYAVFLRQTPWYRYPFGPELVRFWRETPLTGGNPIRKIERRFALSLEYGAKALYAQGIGALAGVSPAATRIQSIVADLDDADLAADPRIVELRALTPAPVPSTPGPIQPGAMLIETPRYDVFTSILRGLGERHRAMIEIAGNRRILTTILAPDTLTPEILAAEFPGARPVFPLTIQSKPGWRRIGLDTDVATLCAQIAGVEARGAIFEHAYDY